MFNKLNENATTVAMKDFEEWCDSQEPKKFVDQRNAFRKWVQEKGEHFGVEVIKFLKSILKFRE